MADISFDKKSELLYKSIEDNQNTIRFTDTKSGAILVLIGIYFTISGTIAKDFFSFLKKLLHAGTIYGISFFSIYCFLFLISLLFVLSATLIVFNVISPNNNPNDNVEFDIKAIPKSTFYLADFSPKINFINVFNVRKQNFKLRDRASVIKDTMDKLTEDSALEILIFELQKVSFIRELKAQRVKIALKMLLVSFSSSLVIGVIFLIQKIIS